MAKLLVANDILEKITCITCSNYLSFFPIYIKNDSSGAICGRCKVIEGDKFIRDEAYENIAQFLQFPCCHKVNGCNEQLTPKKLEHHEKYCGYRKFECPSRDYTKCQWQGPCVDLLKHFEDKHPALLLKEAKFELNFVKSYKENIILPLGNELFVVNREVDSRRELFVCTVQHLRPTEHAEYYDYFIRIITGNNTYTHKYPEKSTVGDDCTTKISGESVKELLKDPPSVIVNIEIFKTCSKEEKGVPLVVPDIKKNPSINWDLLAELECPICFDFMLPPIYQCLDGHSICNTCKPKITQCPLCKKGIQDTKNFVLEKMTQFLTYPCKFYKSGCTAALKSTAIRKHEDNCEFGPYECPLKQTEKCDWMSNSSEVLNHVDNKHGTRILKSDRIDIAFNKNENVEYFYLIKFSEKVFRLHYKYADRKFYWSLQLVGHMVDCDKFKFEVDIIDNSGSKLRCYLKGLCAPFTDTSNSFGENRKYMMMILEQLELLITDSFSYRVRVIKD